MVIWHALRLATSFKPVKPFQWLKTLVPRSWRSKITLIDASGHINQKLPIFSGILLSHIFPLNRNDTSNLEPKANPFKQSSHEKRCFKLEGHLQHATLPKVDYSWKKEKNEWIKEKEKLIVILCTWEIRSSPNINRKNDEKCVNTNHFFL